MTPETAEILALQALAWLAGDEIAIGRFLDLSGLDMAALREAADSPETGAAVLDFLLANEDLLLRFCEEANVPPRDLHLARHRLGGSELREI
ncbi:MAG TPA: DUF3572 family protein [Rhizomicrobium sp.]|jgi:hypothetical protein|nr:DUF3572 family protein [Rhizomicrobium sp.]